MKLSQIKITVIDRADNILFSNIIELGVDSPEFINSLTTFLENPEHDDMEYYLHITHLK